MADAGAQPESLHGAIQKKLISQADLAARIADMGREISADYAGKNPLLIGVLKGVLIFMADLIRAIDVPLEIDFMSIASYSADTRQRGVVRLEKDLSTAIAGRHVLFVEDVIDTGLTLNYLLRNLRAREPASLEVCALFNKASHRLIDLPVRYTGFELPNQFIVGYGLDYREQYRNLPYVGLLKADIFQHNG